MSSTRQLLLINPNTTSAVTERLAQHLQPLMPAEVQLRLRTAAFGAPYIANEASCAVAAHAVLQAWADQTGADWGQVLSTSGAPKSPGVSDGLPGGMPNNMPATMPDGVLIGCFGDPGLFALREACHCPVTGLAEASFIEA